MATESDGKANFEAYNELFRDINLCHPQRQGLLEEEYEYALERADTVLSTIGGIAVPQMVSIKAFEWLNSTFYEERFPEAYDTRNLFHVSLIPGFEPSNRMGEVVRKMGQDHGVLVFDFPSADKDYQRGIVEFIGSSGAKIEEMVFLGAQTYYSGITNLNRGQTKEKQLFFTEAFDNMVKKGEIDPSTRNEGAYLERVVEGGEADELYGFFAAAYQTISDHPCAQSLDPDEFKGMLSDPSIAKIVFRRGGVAETICLITNDISRLSWVNTGYYQKEFPEQFGNKQVVWFPGIATDPDPQKIGHNVPHIMQLLAKVAEKGNSTPLVVFDTPDMNTGFLDKYLEQEINKTEEVSIKFKEIGAQHYFAVKLGSKN